ncbi:hypothetical protein HORIV_54600 [Vreelandella olivaria]|uniref:Transposase n=1 Tax=Vreelandella olivaria TaxID=390919 RepID=A0ABM7GQQ6_9GAMM|nr:hypothetical protein HORIV_54600 [Halomonas olivaria]
MERYQAKTSRRTRWGIMPSETVTQEMYAKRRHIYVREIKGVFQKLRRSANWALMLAFFSYRGLTSVIGR